MKRIQLSKEWKKGGRGEEGKGKGDKGEAKGRTLSNGSPSMEWLMLKRAACCGRREGR